MAPIAFDLLGHKLPIPCYNLDPPCPASPNNCSTAQLQSSGLPAASASKQTSGNQKFNPFLAFVSVCNVPTYSFIPHKSLVAATAAEKFDCVGKCRYSLDRGTKIKSKTTDDDAALIVVTVWNWIHQPCWSDLPWLRTVRESSRELNAEVSFQYFRSPQACVRLLEFLNFPLT